MHLTLYYIFVSLCLHSVQCTLYIYFLVFFLSYIRPVSQAGRPVSGFLRPGTQLGGGSGSSLEQAIKAPRTAQTAR